MPHASDRYSEMEFKNTVDNSSMDSKVWHEYPKWVHRGDKSKICQTQREELDFMQSVVPETTKEDTEKSELLAMLEEARAKIVALEAKEPEKVEEAVEEPTKAPLLPPKTPGMRA